MKWCKGNCDGMIRAYTVGKGKGVVSKQIPSKQWKSMHFLHFPASRRCAEKSHSDGFPETLEIVGKSTLCSICCPCRQISFQAALDARPCIPSNVYRKPLDSLVFLLGPTRRSAVLQGFTLTDLPISDGFPKTSIKQW